MKVRIWERGIIKAIPILKRKEIPADVEFLMKEVFDMNYDR